MRPFQSAMMALGLAAAAALAPCASAQIVWRVSVKMIRDADGNLPSAGNLNTHAEVRAALDLANEILERSERGYQIEYEIVDVYGADAFFDVDPLSDYWHFLLEITAQASPVAFAWRSDAVNIYVNGNSSSAESAFPWQGRDTIFAGQNGADTMLLHELGHYFGLLHTFEEGGDGIADTLVDNSAWRADAAGRDSLEDANPGASTAEVNNTYYNIMCYRTSIRDRFTSDQLDRLSDTSNDDRREFVSGETVYLKSGASAANYGRDSSAPCGSIEVADRVSAEGGDILLFREGSYDTTYTFSRPRTLRATRGDVVIGRAAP